ncbi:MAG TPA: D-alanyl-D-alanine carboxypeptidase family protein [Chthoniobacteraceae bacterium]|jgi:D-alanyl-D-alanine carboxypeptidase (penicillin-binding protein 5/6)|nr:D-alanyl-D-alanine carboxypeptidase family protein [Chthoniobacteraceae bacterium]
MVKLFRNPALLCAALFVSSSVAIEAAPKKKKPAAASSGTKARPTPGSTPAPGTLKLLQDGELPLSAKGAIVLDSYLGAPLYEKSADLPLYPASTTKVLTALIVIETGNLDQEVEIAEEETKVGEASLNLKVGERFTRRQMLYGLMLKSANDVAHSLARDNAGTVEAFAAKMTVRAHELGAINSNFRNPHGLTHRQHITTARDLAIIMRAAMQQPLFRQIVRTRQITWESTLGSRLVASRNRLLYEFPEFTGGKTGFTNAAQHTLATAACRDGREVIATVLHDTKAGKWEDTKLLLTYGFNHRPEPDKPVPKFN